MNLVFKWCLLFRDLFFVYLNFPAKCISERSLKIGQHLAKIWTGVWCRFLTHGVVISLCIVDSLLYSLRHSSNFCRICAIL